MQQTEQAVKQLETATGINPQSQQDLSRQVVAGQLHKATNNSSPVNKAHLLTFSQMPGINPHQQPSPTYFQSAAAGQYVPSSDTKVKFVGSFNQQLESAQRKPINPKATHQTPFFNKLDQRLRTEKQAFSPSTELSGPVAELSSGQKLMHQLMAITVPENHHQLKNPQKAEEPIYKVQANSNLKKQKKATVPLSELTSLTLAQQNPILSPKLKLMRNRFSGGLSGEVPALPKSFTTASLQTGQKKILEEQQWDKKGQLIKFLPSRNSTNPKTRTAQTKSAYLTTTKPIKYDRGLDSGHLGVGGGQNSKNNQHPTEGKPKTSSRNMNNGPTTSNYPPQFNPALIYGKQTVTQPKPTPFKPVLSRTCISDKQSREIHQTQTQLLQSSKTVKDLNLNLKSGGKKHSSTTKNIIPKSSILARNPQVKPVMHSLNTPATTTSFKRNRHLIDKNGQRVQLESSKNKTFSQASQQMQKQSTVDDNLTQQNKQQHTHSTDHQIDVQVNIQSSPIIAQKSPIPVSILNEAAPRPVQVPQQQPQNRQASQISAQLQQNSNSSQGFISSSNNQPQQQEETISLSQKHGKNGDITTQLSFKFNRNLNNQEQTGVELKLTHGEDPFTSDSQPMMQLSMPPQPYQSENVAATEHQNSQAQDNLSQMLLLSPQNRHLNPTLYQAYQSNFQYVADETFSTAGSPGTLHLQQFPNSQQVQQQHQHQLRSNQDTIENGQHQTQLAPAMLLDKQQSVNQRTMNMAGVPRQNYYSQPTISPQYDAASLQNPEMSLETYFRRQQEQQEAVYDMMFTDSANGGGAADTLMTNLGLKESQPVEDGHLLKGKDHFQRILTAKSQQILTRVPKNATNNGNSNPLRRKYRPVLPKNPNNLISMSVKVSKSPNQNTIQRPKQSAVSDNRTMSPQLNTEARDGKDELEDKNIFSFQKMMESDQVAVFQGKQSWTPTIPEEMLQSSLSSQYYLNQPQGNKTGLSEKQNRQSHKVFTPTKLDQSDPNVTATFLVSGLPTGSRQITEAKRYSCRPEEAGGGGQFSENQLTVGKIRQRSCQAVTPFMSSEQNRRSNTSHSRKQYISDSTKHIIHSEIHEVDHHRHHSLKNSNNKRQHLQDKFSESLEVLQQQVPSKSPQNELSIGNHLKDSFLDEQIRREKRGLSITNIDVSSMGSQPMSPALWSMSANLTPTTSKHQTLEQAMRSHLQHRQFTVPARSSITSKSRRSDKNGRKTNSVKGLHENETQSQATSMERSDQDGAQSVGHRVLNISRLFPGQAKQSIQTQPEVSGFHSATPNEERAKTNPHSLRDKQRYQLESNVQQNSGHGGVLNGSSTNQSQCLQNQLLKLNNHGKVVQPQEKSNSVGGDIAVEYVGPATAEEQLAGSRLAGVVRGANLDGSNRNLLQVQQYGNVLSIDSMSQASSTRRTGKVKVIYNKFFKKKGFFPPLAGQTKDYQTHNQVSRSQSVSSQVSYDNKTNGTLESLRMRNKSPESQAAFIGSSEHSEKRIVSKRRPHRVNKHQGTTTLSKNRDESSRKRSLHHDFEKVDRFKSAADRADQVVEPDQSLFQNINLVDYSLESKQEPKAENEGMQSCFSQALNMALSKAPIQQRSYPYLAKPQKLAENVPQWASDEKPPSNLMRNQFNQPPTQGTVKISQFSKNSKTQKVFVPQNSLGSVKGIKYTGKQNPEEAIKRFSKHYLQRKSVTEQSDRNHLGMPRKQSDVFDEKEAIMGEDPFELVFDQELPSHITEPGHPEVLIQEGTEDDYIINDDEQDDSEFTPPPFKHGKVTFIQKIKIESLNSNGFAERGSEERKAEGQQYPTQRCQVEVQSFRAQYPSIDWNLTVVQESLKKIVKNDKQKQRLKSSKIISNPKISQGVMSPIKGHRKLKTSNKGTSHQFLAAKTEEYLEPPYIHPDHNTEQLSENQQQERHEEASRLSSYLNRVESNQTNISQPKVATTAGEAKKKMTSSLLIQAKPNSIGAGKEQQAARPHAALKQSRIIGNTSIQTNSLADTNSVSESTSHQRQGRPPIKRKLITMSRNHMTEKHRISNNEESPTRTYMVMSKRLQSSSGDSRKKIVPLLQGKDQQQLGKNGSLPKILAKLITPKANNQLRHSISSEKQQSLEQEPQLRTPIPFNKQSFKNSYISISSQKMMPQEGETNLTFGLIQQQRSLQGSDVVAEQERQRKQCLKMVTQKSQSSLASSILEENQSLEVPPVTTQIVSTLPFMIPVDPRRISLSKHQTTPMGEDVDLSIEELLKLRRRKSGSSKPPPSIAIKDQGSRQSCDGSDVPRALVQSKSGTYLGGHHPAKEGSFSEYYQH